MTAVGAALLLLNPGPAQATSARTWVASNGTNNATCSRATPCQTFDQAQNATSAGGEINCVDAANYGPVTITKSLTIACDNTEASIFAATGSITINVLADASDIVILKGIDIEGAGSGVVGIDFFTGGPFTSTRSRSGVAVSSGSPWSADSCSNRPGTPSCT